MIITSAKIAQTADSAKQMAKYFVLGAVAVILSYTMAGGGLPVRPIQGACVGWLTR